MPDGAKLKIHLSTSVLIAIGLFDLVTSVVLFRMGMTESNPLFRPLLRMGMVPFALGKIAFIAGPVALIEWARTKSPKSAEQGAWIAAIAYAALYTLHVSRLWIR